MLWGTFAPDEVVSHRRLQTLKLGTAVRHYNERSVPGLGGLWFGMPIAWGLLGIWLAEECEALPLQSANAIEAAMMVQGLVRGAARTRGKRNLVGVSQPNFKELCRRGSYITQPYRMNTVEPLLRLGFVSGAGQRFNLYRLNETGESFLKQFEKEKQQVLRWQEGKPLASLPRLGPEMPLPTGAAQILNRQLRDHGSAFRRRALLDLPKGALSQSPLLDSVPPSGIDLEHWQDLRSGVALFRLREAALAVLSRIEHRLEANRNGALTLEQSAFEASAEITQLRIAATTMRNEKDTSPGHLAHGFAGDCTVKETVEVVEKLVARDGIVIRLISDRRISLGPAGGESERHNTGEDDQAISPEAGSIVPELPRIGNLVSLAADLQQSAEAGS